MANIPTSQPLYRPPSPNSRPMQPSDPNQSIQRGPSPYRPAPPGPGGGYPNQRPAPDPRFGNPPLGRPFTPPGGYNMQTRPPTIGVSPSPPLPSGGYRPPSGIPQQLPGQQTGPRSPISPSYRPGQIPTVGQVGSPPYPNHSPTATGPGYQMATPNSTSPPPVEQRASTPPTASTHKPKRLYPKQITEAYTETNTYDSSYQSFTPSMAPGVGQQPPLQQNLYQQPQFFTPAGNQNFQATPTPVTPMYNQQYAQPQKSTMTQLSNQFSSMGFGGTPQSQLIPVQLIGVPPNVRDLDAPPPPINLPPNSTVTPSDKANCDPSYKRCTINAVPGSSSLLNKSRLPFALVVTPYRSLKDGDDPVPVVIGTSALCYANDFSTNLLIFTFDITTVPPQFDLDLQTNQPTERWKRAELNHAVVEYVAPTEYMSNASEPQMLVVSDLEDVFLPQPDDLLVNLTESRAVVESLLSRLGDMFKDTQIVGNSLGSALLAGFKLISPIGGKIVTILSSLPSNNPGALKPREDPKAL
ncbi:11010_t:CDS:2, partial [Acaulospora colombiana]